MVLPGSYSNIINHYNILRLLEDMFNTTHAGAASTATPIDYCWGTCAASPIITASGPVTFCQGGSVTLTSSTGNSYLWSNGQTSSSVSVTTPGNYSVSVVDAFGCTSNSPVVSVVVNSFISNGEVFIETMGTVSSTTAISTHSGNSGFDKDALVFTGTGDVRSTLNSSGYTGASGLANIFLTNTAGRNFLISGVNTSGLSNLVLSFGLFKSTTTSNASDFSVKVSSDGVNYSSLTLAALPTGTGTAKWYYVTASGIIPAVSNLRIQFLQNGSLTQYRIDDVSLKYTLPAPVISANGSTTLCPGGSVVINSTAANGYAWSNGLTTQNITASTAGNYNVVQTDGNGCTAASNVIGVSLYTSPAVSGFLPVSATPGTAISIFGSGFSGVTSVNFNGVPSTSFSIVNNGLINAVLPAGASSGGISVFYNCGSVSSVAAFTVLPAQIPLTIKLFIEGYYLGAGLMRPCLYSNYLDHSISGYIGPVAWPVAPGPTDCDTITISAMDAVTYAVVQMQRGILKTDGSVAVTFSSPVINGQSYYIRVTHRNALETWSSTPVVFNVNALYDFTTALNKAFSSGGSYPDMMHQMTDGQWAILSGDYSDGITLGTHDGSIDLNDFLTADSDISFFRLGYLYTDLNGDVNVDLNDYVLWEFNNSVFAFTQHP
jgi:hypothetical protein